MAHTSYAGDWLERVLGLGKGLGSTGCRRQAGVSSEALKGVEVGQQCQEAGRGGEQCWVCAACRRQAGVSSRFGIGWGWGSSTGPVCCLQEVGRGVGEQCWAMLCLQESGFCEFWLQDVRVA